jgi:hypothetical protein
MVQPFILYGEDKNHLSTGSLGLSKTDWLLAVLVRVTRPDKSDRSLPWCQAYSLGTHARNYEDRLLIEFPCNPTRTRSV